MQNLLAELTKNIETEGDAAQNFIQQALKGDDEVQQKVLYWMLEKFDSLQYETMSETQKRLTMQLIYDFITSLIANCKTFDSQLSAHDLLIRKGFEINETFHYSYLKLMNMFQRERVVEYLKEHIDKNLDFDTCSKICRENPEAKSFLLERTGEITSSIVEIIKELQEKLKSLVSRLNDEAKKRDKDFKPFDVQSNVIMDEREKTAMEEVYY